MPEQDNEEEIKTKNGDTKVTVGVPAGWGHASALFGRFIKHTGDMNGHGAGGSATHGHNGDAHTHGLNYPAGNGEYDNSANNTTRRDHTHTTGAASYPSLTGAVSNLPVYMEVAFLVKS